jgi:CRP-like cAMP-binding protein
LIAATAAARTVGPRELLELDRESLLTLFQTSPRAALSLLAALSHMTRKADELLRSRVSRNADVEAAEHLTRFQRASDAISASSDSPEMISSSSSVRSRSRSKLNPSAAALRPLRHGPVAPSRAHPILPAD